MARRDPQRDVAEFTDAHLDDLAAVTPEDVERAQRAWRRDTAGTGMEGLLDAQEEGENADGDA